ncbi:MAG: hypothetical protein JXR32_08715 [Anaerolineaceae bacterium]|nr:hypothetical protein [Anaerolineaceae bacterium]
MSVRSAIPLFIILIASLACSLPGLAWLPFLSSDPVNVPGTIYYDDFSNPNTGWYTQYTDDHSVLYDWGGLRFRINRSHFDMWSYPDGIYADAIIWVEAAKLEGTDDNTFGLLCRIQNDGDFYAFLISSDGYAGVARRRSGEYHVLSDDNMTYSELVASPTGLFRLRAVCEGSELDFFVNDLLVASAIDDGLISGKVGVLAGTYAQAGVDIFFDNFIVTVP